MRPLLPHIPQDAVRGRLPGAARAHHVPHVGQLMALLLQVRDLLRRIRDAIPGELPKLQ